MRYVVIGSGMSVPQHGRAAPCHLVQTAGGTVVIDLGPGAAQGLLGRGAADLTQVGLILLTHLHPDHCADLAPALFALRSGELDRKEPLRVIGPEGLLGHYRALRAVWGHRVEPRGFELIMEEWAGRDLHWNGISIGAAPTLHSVVNLAWRVDPGGRSVPGLVVTGDGEGTEALVAMARAAPHVLVAECSAGPGQAVGGHMNPAQAGRLASRCGSVKLILTHIAPGQSPGDLLFEAAEHFTGEVVVAEDGMVVELDREMDRETDGS